MGTFSEAGRFMMFLDGLWVGRGRARPPAGLAACVGCNKASNRIWRRQGGRCFLINVDLLAARGIASCSLRRQPASSTFLWFRAFFRTCKTSNLMLRKIISRARDGFPEQLPLL